MPQRAEHARRAPGRPRPGSSKPERFLGLAAAIFVVAFLVRLVHLFQIRDAPFFGVLMGDSRAYDLWAQQLAGGDWRGREVFYQAPLYPYFLGLVYAVAGRDLLIVRIVQAFIGSLACVLLGYAGWRFFSGTAGVIAGLALALYAPAIFFDGLIQKSVADVFFVCLMLALLGRVSIEPSRRSLWLWLGLAVGCLSLTRENALVFVVVLVVAALVWDPREVGSGRQPRDRRAGSRASHPAWSHAGVFLLGLSLVVLPVAVRNYAVGGELVLTTTQFGPNFYIGNNERADGTYMSLRFGRGAPEYERVDATELAEQAEGRSLSPEEVSRYWTRRALSYIAAEPRDWVALMARKAALLWNATEMLDTESQDVHAEQSLVLRIAGTVGHFGVLVPLAVFGMIASWPARRRVWVLYAMVAAYSASVVMFYVFARYRYPLVPFLLLFAAAGLAAAPRFIRGITIARAAVTLTAVLAAAVLANRPMLYPDVMRAITETNLGAALHEAGRHGEAASHYRRAIALRSDYAPAYSNLGASLRAQGQIDQAIEQYEHALRLRADYPSAKQNLVNALRAKGDALASRGALDQALPLFRRAVELSPEDGGARYELATALLEAKRVEEAADQLRAVLMLMPGSVEARNNLGIALASQGKLDEAIVEFQEALRIQPDFSDARRNLEMAMQAREEVGRAGRKR
jgi:tetratricopeptide (TPR) repeat protein